MSIIWSDLLGKLEHHDSPASLDEFVHSRRKDKEITQELTEQLCKTFITPLEREDIQALAAALYKIPKDSRKNRRTDSDFPERPARSQFQETSGVTRSGRGNGAGHGKAAAQRDRFGNRARKECALANDRRRCGQTGTRIVD